MNLTLHQELFEYSACPIFTFSADGKILYKNRSAKKYFPMLRKNASVLPHLYLTVLPAESGILHIVGDTPYRKVLALKEGSVFYAFGLIRLQLSDGHHVGERILRYITDHARKLPRHFHTEKNARVHHKRYTVSRVYTDIFEAFHYPKTDFGIKDASFYEIIPVLFEKLSSAFTALGYRIHAAIDNSFVYNRAPEMHPNDFLFLFGMFLYLQMRLSESGEVSIALKSDSEAHILRFSVKAQNIGDPDENIFEFFKTYLPECACELRLLEDAGILHMKNCRLSYGDYGIFTAEYRIPFGEELSPAAESTPFAHYFPAIDVSYFLDTLQGWLKDNGASC